MARARLLSRVGRLALLLLLIATLGLILSPLDPRGDTGSDVYADVLRRRISKLETALDRGAATSIEVSEAQLNAYLADVVEHTNVREPGRTRMRMDTVNVSFTPDSFIVLILVEWGPVSLSYEVTALPLLSADGFAVDVLHVRLGRLSLPSVIAKRVVHRMAGAFAQMNRERFVLDRLEMFTLDRGRASLSVGTEH